MARETPLAVRRSANRIFRGGGLRGVDHGRVGEGNRAQSMHRRRYRARDTAPVRAQPRTRLIDRMTYGDDTRVSTGNPSARGNTGIRGVPANTFLRTANNSTQHTDNPTGNPTIAAQDPQDSSLFCTQDSPSTATQAPALLRPYPTESLQPAQRTTSTPLPNVTTTPKPKASTPPIKLINKPPRSQANRGDTYRGNDPIKLKVQNPKLRAIFADKPIPRTPKKHDEPVLRMGLRDKELGLF
ncbi:hypothetical protein K458DRAFT_383131 [Lentithecium fluviatile CBS 122367]|uniref:Uncharacterized protein n=1 Tax=Lentithecium fluviatile CBS 122367 TaxID=1168545 RepID=A0A6G1JIN6_9PLEO|nr:hypothetical protein K458DRAFT_383131 [Lentithecium fluviatile CBS 122367]